MNKTIDRIVEASKLPLSIVIVGVGQADFTNMASNNYFRTLYHVILFNCGQSMCMFLNQIIMLKSGTQTEC